jgi:hypothetical protein
MHPFRVILTLLLALVPATLHAEVLFRWDGRELPSREALGISTIVVPAADRALVERAQAEGYRVYLELPAASTGIARPAGAIAGVVVRGGATAAQVRALRQRLPARMTVRVVDERGKWPHIRSNAVTTERGVLQVASRTAQPWIENNAALIRIARSEQPGRVPLISYTWVPTLPSGADQAPAIDDYLVAIAEAGSFGADLVLPVHEQLRQALLLGTPDARAGWERMRAYAAFYSWNLPARYSSVADVGVVASDPMRWFEVMNLLARHDVPFEIIAAKNLVHAELSSLDALVVLDAPTAADAGKLAAFAQQGGTVVLAGVSGAYPWQSAAPDAKTAERVTYRAGQGRVVEFAQPVVNPNDFALDVRQLVAKEKRAIEIWNGITVLVAPYVAPDGGAMLVTALNYTQQPLEIQCRVRGTFAAIHYESPDGGSQLLPFQQREGSTEFVIPALRVGGRVFLEAASQ